jgi:hypothetical protein
MTRAFSLPALLLGAALLAACHPADPVVLATWSDPATGLTWQDPPFAEHYAWADAGPLCTALRLDGQTDWRLPTLDELRTLARGCPATVTGGACVVTDACSATTCWTDVCQGCEENGGSGSEGSYRLPVLTGDYMTSWTSTVPPDAHDLAWTVGFGGCHVMTFPKDQDNINVRCVR